MGKVKEMSMAIEDLRRCADLLNETADWLGQFFGSDDVPRQPVEDTAENVKPADAETAAPVKPALTIEQVRAVLAEKSRSGHTAEVRELLRKYGAAKLSQIDPANYEALMADAEVLGNG